MTETSILVVEDEVLIAEEIVERLTNLGFKVPASVTTGEEAIEKATDIHPDLILMDINLDGEIDGIEAARQIRTQFDIPVVFLSAFSDDETLERAQVTDPNGYITKPFRDRQLYIAIKIALKKHEKEETLNKELGSANEQLKTVDDVKQNIISNVSHELRTPLTIAHGALELLDEEVNEESQEFLNIAKNALDRQNNVIGDLVRLAQLKDNSINLDIRKINLKDLISPVVAKIKSLVDKNGVKVQSDVPDIEILVDSGDIETALLNVLDNSVKFNKDNGEITISAKNVGNTAIISIHDTGIGIAKEHQQKVFDDFYQIDASATRRYGGTGSGLAVAKKIVELHGGEIWVESEPDVGSTFHIGLPLAEEEA